jgi:hypothetical protein
VLMGVYRESWFTQFRLPSVVKTLKIYREAWGKNTVYRFRTLFKDLPLKYQNFTVKIPKFLLFTDFQIPPSRPSFNEMKCNRLN